MNFKRLFFGPVLPNRDERARKIGALEGVPAMGLDGLGSSAYGPEAALTVLIPLGAAGTGYVEPITAVIVVLLAILYLSYRQTIRAYPSNGGAYTVAKANLGREASLLAAAALMIDYVLNVAVGISAGVAALISAIPSLQPYTLWLCLCILALVTLINLRGTLDAGRLFALPTYTFAGSFFILLAIGIYKAATSGPPPSAPLAQVAGTASAWVLMHAFASGCTAMTGVEAVSNGVGAFREPAVKYAHRTLTAIVLILGILLAGIAYLANAFHIAAMDQSQAGYQSVLSQLATSVVGRGAFYYVAIGSLLCVLALSANTSFTDFPRLCRTIAQDDFLPRPFAVVGRRLVFSVGIAYLALTAGLLLIVFNGITEHLIPLFAIGAFLTFTLSQAGMVVHWRREYAREPSSTARARMGINAVGALATGVAFVIILLAKFTAGAWITLLVIPAVMVLLHSVNRYYAGLKEQMREEAPLAIGAIESPTVLVVVEEWSRLTDKALTFAMHLSKEVIAVHLMALSGPDDVGKRQALEARWADFVEAPARAAGHTPPRLLVLQAQYRRMHEPLIRLLRKIETNHPGRPVAILIPELIKRKWWQYPLHTHRARRLRTKLLQCGSEQVVVINVPWFLEPVASAATVDKKDARAGTLHGASRPA
ncbi:MAG: ydaO [Variovorax sp.]|jgi:amino acid transporter|nr:ydaO [Variovorax sp.]